MAPITCPSCGAELTFRTSFSVYAVCPYCGCTVVRRDRDVESIGTMADLPDEMTPLQVGTELTWGGERYRLAGRVRMAWSDGAWNEWFMVAGGEVAWLAEAQGFLTIATPVPITEARGYGPAALPGLDATISIQGKTYTVTDIKDATCVGSEGELPFAAPRGRKATYYDMLAADGGFASVEAGSEGRDLYIGSYVAFDDLGFVNLRSIERWTPPASAVEARDPVRPAAT
ncbi:MAG TPA: DUF4178 domain-containing protein [Acidisphaera sp.]|nr:DUF4178 domain-containing protein [Acidisphaera sp.]